MLQVLAHGYDGFWQARFLVPGIDGEVKDRRASVSQTVSHFGTQQPAISSDVDPESFFGCVIHHLVSELRAQQWLSPHQREYAAAVIVEPINGPPGHVLGHALDLVVVSPAVPAVEIAFVLDKQVGGDGMELAGSHARPY